ncbi:Uncharacterized protein OnM2_044032 [Erysiphe neolycopersici]|uniref:Serine/threonine-protein phosphatase 4 regulatory subunit 3-like central domain-containing protein n=1 Tax=Erysiphe neolycopersici TaxID=212602 RepID=A0A420HUZ3_9PEZI|nr:Uncharacterized protein OnM2_044032 [Erysiphe neolycopersici]
MRLGRSLSRRWRILRLRLADPDNKQNEATRAEEPHLFVYSEKEPDCTILDTKIYATEGFKKQSETLIVWKESRTNLDMALSFQESEACSTIWKFVDQVQQQFYNLSNTYDVLSDDITADSSYGPITLPTPSLASLPEVEMQMRGIQLTDQGRDALTKYVLTEDYIQKLVPLVEMAEDMEDLASLHRLCNIMKTLILLNDTTILELSVSDGVVMGVVGALEYDPDFPTHKANHRQWLAKDGRYKEVVHIDDDVCRKIHSTYRLQYLKDVVLARILDDPTFSVLNSLIFFNQVDIVQHLQSNPLLLKSLFGIFKAQQTDQKRKKEAVLFIQQCCAIGKTLQPNARQQLYDNFLSHGLLSVINFSLRHSDPAIRVGATDVLVSMIDHDPQMIRQTIFRQISEKQTPLTDSLIDLLLVEFDMVVKAQISDAIKVLLDVSHSNAPQDNSSKPLVGDCSGRLRIADPQQMEFIKEFYNESAMKLFKPLVDLKDRKDMNFSVREASLFIYLIEILCFFIRQHTHYSKFFVLSENLGQRIVQLLSSSEKYLKLCVVKFIRSLVGLQDDFYNQQIIQGKLLEPILDLIIESLPRDSLLNSAAFELFSFIGREKINNLTIHLVENYRDKMMKITNVDTFSYLITRYDSSQGFSIIHTDTEDETPALPRPPLCGRWESGLKDLDAQEEEYFNTSDEDEEETNGYPSPPEISNVKSPLKKPLVDYLSDEDDTIVCDPPHENRAHVDENTPPRNLYDSPKSPCDGSRIASLSPSPCTPEKLSEKRRREADEIDEIDKLSQANKRRNSMSSIGSNSILRRKKKFSNNPGSNSTRAKIAISISPVGKKTIDTVKISDSSIDSTFLESSG